MRVRRSRTRAGRGEAKRFITAIEAGNSNQSELYLVLEITQDESY